MLRGDFIVYKRYRFSPVRHPEPFNKTRRGKARRLARRFKLQHTGILQEPYYDEGSNEKIDAGAEGNGR